LALFEIAGSAAREILSMGCALDAEGPSMALGRCARTDFAGLRALIYPHAVPDRYRLHVDRPLARHLAEWFAEAATAVA